MSLYCLRFLPVHFWVQSLLGLNPVDGPLILRSRQDITKLCVVKSVTGKKGEGMGKRKLPENYKRRNPPTSQVVRVSYDEIEMGVGGLIPTIILYDSNSISALYSPFK